MRAKVPLVHCYMHWSYDTIWLTSRWYPLSNHSAVSAAFLVLTNPICNVSESYSRLETDANEYREWLTHWGRVTHICVSKLTTIGSDNGLSPGRRQAIIWTNAVILTIRTLGTNFSDILSEIRAFSLKKMHLKMSSAKWRPFCPASMC